jgi:hypothetical protein
VQPKVRTCRSATFLVGDSGTQLSEGVSRSRGKPLIAGHYRRFCAILVALALQITLCGHYCMEQRHRRALSGQRIFHGHGVISHPWQHVRIGVQGDRDGGVSQKLLHKLGINTFREEHRGAGVPSTPPRCGQEAGSYVPCRLSEP